ncbi:MAG TPA: hypothetical protein VKG21_11410 [Casimicrobiaceae bacterium]|nr:hypothetical protein [Casimicrobiaceae bacterium]
MSLQNRFDVLLGEVAFAHQSQQTHPEHRHRFVVLARNARSVGKAANRQAHSGARLLGRARFLQVRPCDAQVLAMVEVPGADLATFETAGEFDIAHG